VVVTGTHGKTTTTSLLGAVLAGAGLDPSVLVGGVALDFGGPFRDGAGPHFVVEGDEYDTAFFDKTPKFLHYHPRTLLLTSVEFDHADIYRDLEHVKEAFRGLVRGMPTDGWTTRTCATCWRARRAAWSATASGRASTASARSTSRPARREPPSAWCATRRSRAAPWCGSTASTTSRTRSGRSPPR
jgi:UDP-N-acetylmuramate: L-alanyl-gamma-D-glutamyl-meso-diaminopimelate ligase